MEELTTIQSKIYEIRGQRVMLDFDLAALYQVTTSALNQAVKRNAERFPEEFMFRISASEWEHISSQFVTTSRPKRPKSSLPLAFTEQGVAMLSGVLRSPKAIEVNINIMRAFVHMRQYLLSHAPKQELEELRKRIEYLEEDISSDRESYEKQFDDLFTAFAKLSAAIQIKQTPLDRVKIEGFKNK